MNRTEPFRVVHLSILILLTSLVLIAPAAAFADDDTGWRLRLFGVYVDPDLGFTGTANTGQPVRVETGTDVGFGIGAEYRFNRRFGFEVSIFEASPRFDLRIETTDFGTLELGDSPRIAPLTTGVTFHLTPDRPADLYLAARVVHVLYGDVMLVDPTLGSQRLRSIDDWGWGVALGADVTFGDSAWGLNLEIAHLDTVLVVVDDEDDSRVRLGLDPLLFQAGVFYRF